MPTIFFFGSTLKEEQRKELVSSFMETASRATGIDPSAFVAYLFAVPQKDVGVGGILLKECLTQRGCCQFVFRVLTFLT